MLFNIYSALERGGQLAEAVDVLDRYLQTAEDIEPSHRAALSSRLDRMREQLAHEELGNLAIGSWVVAGTLAISFVVFAALSEVEDQRLAAACGRDRVDLACPASSVGTLEAYNIVADLSWSLALVGAAAGALLYLLRPPRQDEEADAENDGPTASLRWAPWASANGSFGLSLGGDL